MKKFAAAALAATMSLSVLSAPAADAASNTMERYGTVCRISLDGDLKGKSGRWDRSKLNQVKDLEKLTEENVGAVRAADLGQAFGSSDADVIAAANNAEAIEACKDGKDYKSEPMDEWKQAGIIIGVIVAVLSVVASAAGPALQQFL